MFIIICFQVYPDDPITGVVRNVFDFDSFTKDTTETIEEVFQKHGIPIGNVVDKSSEIRNSNVE